MKKIILLLCFYVLPAGAQLYDNSNLSCMKSLPEVVVVDPQLPETTFSKRADSDGFWDYEKEKKGWGYSQSYRNGGCLSTVYLYNADLPNISLKDLREQVTASTHFRSTKQERVFVHGVEFESVTGYEGDQINLLLLGIFQNNFLKIRTTCQNVNRLDQAGNEKLTQDMTTKLTEIIMENLTTCLMVPTENTASPSPDGNK